MVIKSRTEKLIRKITVSWIPVEAGNEAGKRRKRRGKEENKEEGREKMKRR